MDARHLSRFPPMRMYPPSPIYGRLLRLLCTASATAGTPLGMAPQGRPTTRFCQRLSVLAPVVLAPMGGCAGGRLAAAVTRAGGVGFVGAGGKSLAHLRSEWAIALSQPGVLRQSLGFGLNINDLEALPPGTLEALLAELQPAHLYLSFGSLAPHARVARAAGVHLYSNAGDTATALAHARDGATCVVMQGSDAGGHTGDRASVFSLVPQARSALTM